MWRVHSIVEIENSVELLCMFQRLPLTNGFFPVPDDKTPEGSEKISIKSLYELFKDTKPYGLLSLQFLSTLNLFFGGDIQTSKNKITELYKNLSFKTLSGKQ